MSSPRLGAKSLRTSSLVAAAHTLARALATAVAMPSSSSEVTASIARHAVALGRHRPEQLGIGAQHRQVRQAVGTISDAHRQVAEDQPPRAAHRCGGRVIGLAVGITSVGSRSLVVVSLLLLYSGLRPVSHHLVSRDAHMRVCSRKGHRGGDRSGPDLLDSLIRRVPLSCGR